MCQTTLLISTLYTANHLIICLIQYHIGSRVIEQTQDQLKPSEIRMQLIHLSPYGPQLMHDNRKLSCDVKLCKEFWCQKLLQSV